MTIGQKIKKLRNEKNLTQKGLADQLYVSFQTISKWENDENEPDLATVRQLAKFFDCSLDYLLSEEEETKEETNEKPQVVVKEIPVIKETVVVHQNEMHVCAKCGHEIKEDELVSEDATKNVRYGKYTKTVSVGQTYYHKNCLEEVKKARALTAKRLRIAKAKKAKKMSFGWGIAGGLVAFGIALLSLLINAKNIHPALSVLYSVLIGYGIFAMLYCIISGSYIGKVFAWCAGITVRFPGLIFSWSLEGIAWLIGMKILFAILGFLFGVCALLFAICFSAILGFVSFPFVLIRNNLNDYADSLTN